MVGTAQADNEIRDVPSIHDEGLQLTSLNGRGPHAGAPVAPQRVMALAPATSDLAPGEIDMLFRAVRARMAQAVGDYVTAASAAHGQDPARHLRNTLLECLHAMDQLYSMVGQERRRLQSDLSALQSVLVGVQTELASTKISEIEARLRARHDGLTNLANAALFRERLDAVLSQSDKRPRAVLFLDIDRFKSVNDSYGHDIGDAVLRIVARRLNGGTRTEDLVSRLGGDEFACLLAGVSSRVHLRLLVRHLFKVLVSPFKIGSLLLSVRPSIGVAVFPADGATSADLLRNADVAMYLAKQRKSGVAFFDERPTRGPLLQPDARARATQAAASVTSKDEDRTPRLDARAARTSAAMSASRQPSSSGPGAHVGPAFDD